MTHLAVCGPARRRKLARSDFSVCTSLTADCLYSSHRDVRNGIIMKDDPNLGKLVAGEGLGHATNLAFFREARQVKFGASAGVVGTLGGHYKQNQTRNGGLLFNAG